MTANRCKKGKSSVNNETVKSIKPAHACCTFCAKTCDCGSIDCKKTLEFETAIATDANELQQPFRVVEKEMKLLVRELLQELRSTLSSPNSYTPVDLSSGNSKMVIDEVILHLPFIKSLTSSSSALV